MSVSNWMLVVGMFLSFCVMVIFGFFAFAIVMSRKLFAKIEEFTTLCVQFKQEFMQLISEAAEYKKKTARAYEDVMAEREYREVDGKIALVPKSVEEAG